jgi:hypothetical protein
MTGERLPLEQEQSRHKPAIRVVKDNVFISGYGYVDKFNKKAGEFLWNSFKMASIG